MKKQTEKEINKAIKELKNFLKICQRARIECEFDGAYIRVVMTYLY